MPNVIVLLVAASMLVLVCDIHIYIYIDNKYRGVLVEYRAVLVEYWACLTHSTPEGRTE